VYKTRCVAGGTTEVSSMVIIQRRHDDPGGDMMSKSTATVTNTEGASLILPLRFFPLAGRGKVFPSLASGPAISTFGDLSYGYSDCKNKVMEIDVHLDPNVNESGIGAERSVLGV
jgi:hypothetical protein